MRRRLDDWLLGHIEYTKWSESPVSYHAWAGVSCIAAALQRKVYLRWGYSTLYPNHYIILVGPSGHARKGEPVLIARSIVDKLSIPVIGEDNSPEAVILEIKNSETTYTDRTNGRTRIQSAVSCFIEELSVFLGKQNTTFLAYLTNWYDARDRWKRTTKHQGIDDITGVCVNMLAATAPDWFPHIFPREAIGGGFTSRCIFVVEEGKGKIVANPNKVPLNKKLREDLVADLEAISILSGEMKLSKGALAFYEPWYEAEEKKHMEGAPPVADPLFSGYNARRASHLKKIAMCISASHSEGLEISEADIKRALALLVNAEKKMPRAFALLGKARFVEETELVLAFVKTAGTVSKAQILMRFRRNLDDVGLETVSKVLTGMKAVRIVRQAGGDLMYEYIGGKDD